MSTQTTLDFEPRPASRTGEPPPRGAGQVLVVDDDESVLHATAMMLRALAVAVQTARDGREATALFRTDPAAFALVLVDLAMPEMDGAATCLALRSIRSDTPIILMTGHPEFIARQRLAGQNVTGILEKPFGLDTMRRVVRSHVRWG